MAKQNKNDDKSKEQDAKDKAAKNGKAEKENGISNGNSSDSKESNKKANKKNKPTKADKQREALKQKLTQERYKNIIDREKQLGRLQRIEKQRSTRRIIINLVILLLATGAAIYLGSNINIFLYAVAVPVLAITAWNIIKAIRLRSKLSNPYEIRKLLVIREAKEEHNKKNKQIQEEYKDEKRRISLLKRLPYRALGSSAFILMMFTLILCYFVLDVQLTTTIFLLLIVFTISYFIAGLVMAAIFYLIGENKARENKIRLEEERRRKTIEERIKSEELLRKKLEAERRRYEQEELLRADEEARAKLEEEIVKARKEEDRRSFELSMHERHKILDETRFGKPILLESSYEQFAKAHEKQKEKFERELLNDFNEELQDFNVGGIEAFHRSKIKNTAYNPTSSEMETGNLEQEMDNALFGIPAPKAGRVTQPVMPDVSAKPKERSVNPQSVSLIKELLKD